MTQNSSQGTNSKTVNVVYVGRGGNIPSTVIAAISKINGVVVANKTTTSTCEKTINLIKQNIQKGTATVFGDNITNNRLRLLKKTGLPFGVVSDTQDGTTIVPYNGFINTIMTNKNTTKETVPAGTY